MTPPMCSIYSNMIYKSKRNIKVRFHPSHNLTLCTDADKTNELKKQQTQNDDDEDSLKNNSNSLLKNLKLSIKRLHIRFEDDYFSALTPFSFGIVID
jgi:hypothetical protein